MAEKLIQKQELIDSGFFLNKKFVMIDSTKYAQDANAKMDLINDHLAGQEMEVGRFYLKKQNYLSALNRFSEVVNHSSFIIQREPELFFPVPVSQKTFVLKIIVRRLFLPDVWR